MNRYESIHLNRKQQRRADVLGLLSAGRITKSEAAGLLEVTEQHIYRLLAEFENRGVASVVHANTGRTPANRTDEETVTRILELAGEGGKYHDFRPNHMHELLAEEEGIFIGRSTLDRLLREHGVRQASGHRRQAPRSRRERSSAEGLLVQIDASKHDWLEGRGPQMSLIGGIDDATGKVVGALFRPTEDQAGYLTLLRDIATRYGLPASYYHDRHTILRSPKEATIEDELAGRLPQSEIQRVFADLGVISIAACSPQAKGRVERLWGTWQDRLPKEMRLAKVNDQDAANAFLPGYIVRHNKRFAVPAADPEPAWVPLLEDTDLAYYFSAREARVVNGDHTISWHRRLFLLLRQKGEISLAKQRVNVHLVPEGSLYIYHGKQRLCYRELEARPLSPAATPNPNAPPAKASPLPSPDAAARRRRWLFGGTPSE